MSDEALPPPSFWLDALDERLEPRPALEGDRSADVAIVGAGYTGLWTAWYLAGVAPDLRIVLVESRIAGFGAAGRNGGWCTAHHAGVERWLDGPKRAQAMDLQRAMFDAVDEVGRVAAAEGIDCDFAKSGYLTVATNDLEVRRIRAVLGEAWRLGFSRHDFQWLDARACDERVRIAGTRGGLYSPHGAALQPARLARGLAEAVERRGVTIHERTPARSVEPGVVVTDGGRLRAGTILVCTEGTTQHLPGPLRILLPLHSMMIATEPLPASFWKDVGGEDRVLFGDVRRILSYAQRTADGRIAIGAGGRYFYGSGVRERFPSDGPDYREAQRALVELFPALRDVAITHRWGGAFGVPRDWKPFVRFDRDSGMGAAGGYVGNGVAAANLAGRTLADLVAGRDTERTTHPWVQHRSPAWEPEPFRWLAVNAILRMGAAADGRERRGRPARLRGALFDAVSGH